jgi:hypothetical protein
MGLSRLMEDVFMSCTELNEGSYGTGWTSSNPLEGCPHEVRCIRDGFAACLSYADERETLKVQGKAEKSSLLESIVLQSDGVSVHDARGSVWV